LEDLLIGKFEKMVAHQHLSIQELATKLKNGNIAFAGNVGLKIYGTLRCASGKRMKKENRVFFENEKEAWWAGFRPCGHCMAGSYRIWKTDQALVVLGKPQNFSD
jgi:methylphosphotriester-DNA--protein-cysteine methyltransferase